MNNDYLEKLFTITNLVTNSNQINADVEINSESEIYKAHFPNNPITPGVCQLYLVKKILNISLNASVVFAKSKSIKYTELLTPNKTKHIKATLITQKMDNYIVVDAQLHDSNHIFLKAKLEYLYN